MAVRMGCAAFGLAVVITALPATAADCGQFKDPLDKVKHSTQHADSSLLGSNLPTSDIAAGLKGALTKGAAPAINSLGRNGGFRNHPRVRIPLPGELEQAGKRGRPLGQGAKVDAFALGMNRAAEKAVPLVAQICGGAIRQMTLREAHGILAGGDHAATDYFRRVDGIALTARIQAIVAKATDSVGVTQKYKSFTSGARDAALGGLPGKFGGDTSDRGASPLDLDDYLTPKALDGLFTVRRKNPFAASPAPVPPAC